MASKRVHQAFDRSPSIPKHPVSVEEWDATMRAALTGIIAEGDRSLSYEQAVAHARVYADAARAPPGTRHASAQASREAAAVGSATDPHRGRVT